MLCPSGAQTASVSIAKCLVICVSRAAAEIHDVDVRIAALGQRQRQTSAIRRERRRAVDALARRHLLARAGREILDEDRRIAALERVVGELAAVRRPRRRQQRLARAHDDLRIEAVRIGDHQRVLDVRRQAGRGDVGDARPERAAHAEDLLVDDVGDLVRDVAERRALAADRKPGHALLLGDVEQLELDAHGAVAARRSRGRRRGNPA